MKESNQFPPKARECPIPPGVFRSGLVCLNNFSAILSGITAESHTSSLTAGNITIASSRPASMRLRRVGFLLLLRWREDAHEGVHGLTGLLCQRLLAWTFCNAQQQPQHQISPE